VKKCDELSKDAMLASLHNLKSATERSEPACMLQADRFTEGNPKSEERSKRLPKVSLKSAFSNPDSEIGYWGLEIRH
jgi:hypothetical protein